MLRALLLLSLLCVSRAAEEKFGPYAEPDFPVLTSTVDFSGWEKQGFPKNNIAVRGLIIKLPHDLYVCFDQDLLRVAGIWQGEPGGKFLTYTTIPAISYNAENKKSEPGQKDLPKPIGKPLMATGLMPGWILKAAKDVKPEDLADPRPPGPDPTEPGRGPLPAGEYHWEGYVVRRNEVVLHYRCGAAKVTEAFAAGLREELPVVRRRITVRGPGGPLSLTESTPGAPAPKATDVPNASPVDFVISEKGTVQRAVEVVDTEYTAKGWVTLGAVVSTPLPAGKENGPFSVENIPLPVPNPWRRNVRPSGICFFPDGRAVVCTIDGDLWVVSGLSGGKGPAEWQRYASGLHEPQSVAVSNGAIHVFTRDGIVRLSTVLRSESDGESAEREATAFDDLQGDALLAGAADLGIEDQEFQELYPVYLRDAAIADEMKRGGFGRTHPKFLRHAQGLEAKKQRLLAIVESCKEELGKEAQSVIPRSYDNFCNAFTQTGETREYPMDMVARPGGGFYIAKGGQMVTRKTPQGGHVLQIPADGKTVTDICSGLRQPYLGIHPKTGLLTASDQQGHWTPSTPIRFIRKGAYYGFEEAAPNPIPSVIDPPACWIPHEVNQSAAGQVWAVNAAMGPLNERLLHLMYFRPGILAAFLDQKQGAVTPTGLEFDFPLLKGAINPADGLLYVCGFRIWGTESKNMAGLARVRPTGKPSAIPTTVRAVPQGIYLKFSQPVDPASLKPEHFAASRWNYKRTSGYGSAHYKLDGTPGMEPLPCTGVQLAGDEVGVLVHLPDMKPAEQYRLDWRMTSAAGAPMNSFATLTLYDLVPFDAAAAEFDPGFKPSPPPAVAAAAKEEPTMEAGKQLITTLGCLACHSTDGKMEGMKGPTWKDLFGSENELVNGKKATVDAAYLRESILKPAAKVRKGFDSPDVGMPPYEGILSESQVESVILYLRSLSQR